MKNFAGMFLLLLSIFFIFGCDSLTEEMSWAKGKRERGELVTIGSRDFNVTTFYAEGKYYKYYDSGNVGFVLPCQ